MAQATPRQTPAYPTAQAIHHELRNAENSAAFMLAKMQSMKKNNPKLALLDVGAGSGTISASFAKALPDGQVIAVDLNPNILPRARAVAEMAGLKNINFQQGDVKKLPFADGTFDITFCHQMLTHISAPEDALREMLRVTKPGGIVAAREGDFETEAIWPELPGLLKFHKFAAEMMNAAGGTSTAGRQLLSWALKAGAERSEVKVSFGTWSYHTPSEKNTWGRFSILYLVFCGTVVLTKLVFEAQALIGQVKGGPLREKGVKVGLIAEHDLEEMAKDWGKWAGQVDSSVAMLHGEIIIQK